MNFYNYIFKDICYENTAILTKDEQISYYDLWKQINYKCELIPDLYDVVILPVQNSKNMIVNLFASIKNDKKIIILNANVELVDIELDGKCIILENDSVKIHKFSNCRFTKKIDEISTINIMTSGTTGKPKICELSLNSIKKRVDMLYEVFLRKRVTVTEGLVFPVFSITALTLQVFPTLLKGGTLVLIENIEELPYYLNEFKLDFLGLTPTVFNLMVTKNFQIFKNVDNLFLGGEKIDFSLIRKICEKLKTPTVYLGYGFTEGCGMISFGRVGDIPENSVGKVLPFVEVRLKTNKELGELGELEIRNNGEEIWIPSGDIAYIKDSYLYIVDRKIHHYFFRKKYISESYQGKSASN